MSDLAPLVDLQNLFSLYINGTEVRDLTPLAELPYLFALHVYDSPVSDLCPVAHVNQVFHDLDDWDWAVCEE